MRSKLKLALLILFLLAAIIPFLKPYVMAYAYGVPTWYLMPRLLPYSVVPFERKMNVTVQPAVPILLGDPITVRVFDNQNATPLIGAAISVSKDNLNLGPILTDSNGTVIFDYPGETTIIQISKDKYQTVIKVIPRIPDHWLRAASDNWITNIITWIITLGSAGAIAIKFRSEIKIKLNIFTRRN